MRSSLVIAGKEIKSYFATPSAYIILVLFTGITGWFFTNTLFIEGGQAEMSSYFGLTPFLYMFIIPALTMRSIAEEKKTGTMEVMTTFPVSALSIVTGKFLGAFFIVILSLFLTFPALLTIGILGKPDWGIVFTSYAGLIMMGASFTAIGIYCSAVTENQMIAFMISFFIIFILMMLDSMLVFLPFTLIFDYISVNSHYHNFLRGIIDTRNIVYFSSMALLFLFSAAKSIESER